MLAGMPNGDLTKILERLGIENIGLQFGIQNEFNKILASPTKTMDLIYYQKFIVYKKELDRHVAIEQRKSPTQMIKSSSISVSASELMESEVMKRLDREKIRLELKKHILARDDEENTPADVDENDLVYKLYFKYVLVTIPASTSAFAALLNYQASVLYVGDGY